MLALKVRALSGRMGDLFETIWLGRHRHHFINNKESAPRAFNDAKPTYYAILGMMFPNTTKKN
jgi:hypothetical protein